MQAQLKDKQDIKIFLLYLLRNINCPLDFVTINDMVMQDGFVNYFDFAECFAELVDSGNIEETRRENASATYIITAQGIEVCDTLYSEILRSIRDKSLRSAYRYITFRDRCATTSKTITQNEDGTYTFYCDIKEHDVPLLTLQIKVTNRRQIEQMKYNFDEHTEEIYADLLKILSEDKSINTNE